MAKQDKRARGSKGGGRRTLLAGLLAVVAVLAAWLSDCLPGFGIGSSGDQEGEHEAEFEPAQPAEAEAEPAEGGQAGAAPSEDERKPLALTIDARGCIVGAREPIDCATICERDELWEGVDEVIIDAEHGPHEVVVGVLDCLKAKQLPVAIKRK